MPITHSGMHVCEKCGKAFKWYRFEQLRTRFSAVPIAEKLPDEKDGVSVCRWEQPGIPPHVNHAVHIAAITIALSLTQQKPLAANPQAVFCSTGHSPENQDHSVTDMFLRRTADSPLFFPFGRVAIIYPHPSKRLYGGLQAPKKEPLAFLSALRQTVLRD